MLNLASTLLSKALLGAVLALSVALAGASWKAYSATNALAVERATHETTKVRLEAAQGSLKAIETKGKELSTASKRAEAAIERLAASAEARAKALRDAPTPQTCQEAVQFLVDDAAGVLP